MTSSERDNVRQQLILHEGLRLSAYQDYLGFWTIGVGRLIDARKRGGISRSEAMVLLDNDINACLHDLANFNWFGALNAVRMKALIDMRFQLGGGGLRGFPKMLAALDRRDYVEAAAHGRDSKWARVDTPERAHMVLRQLESGREEG